MASLTDNFCPAVSPAHASGGVTIAVSSSCASRRSSAIGQRCWAILRLQMISVIKLESHAMRTVQSLQHPFCVPKSGSHAAQTAELRLAKTKSVQSLRVTRARGVHLRREPQLDRFMNKPVKAA